MTSPRLEIIMPVSRPKNLPVILHNYLEAQEPHGFELRIKLMVQGPEKDEKGLRKANEGVMAVNSPNSFCWTPSDDSTQPLNLFRCLDYTLAQHPHARVVVFSERRSGVDPRTGDPNWGGHELGILRAYPDQMKPHHVDATQCFFRRDCLPTPAFDFEKHGCIADGMLIQTLYQRMPDAFVFLPHEFVWFGSLD